MMDLNTEHPLIQHLEFARTMVAAELNRAQEARNGNPFTWSGVVTTEDNALTLAAMWMISGYESLLTFRDMAA